jgi:hypothetical protein
MQNEHWAISEAMTNIKWKMENEKREGPPVARRAFSKETCVLTV